MPSNNDSIFVLIPAYNEEASLQYTIRGIRKNMPRAQIIICDNGSEDDTVEIAKKENCVVTVETRKGYGYVLMKGVKYVCRKMKTSSSPLQQDKNDPALIFMDADGSDDPKDMTKHLEVLETKDFSIGSRTKKIYQGVTSLPHFLANRFFGFLLFLRTRRLFTDLGPFRALRLSTFQKLEMKDYTYGWTAEMQRRVMTKGFSVEEFWTLPRARYGGYSKVSGARWWKQVKIGVQIIWRIFI